MMPQYLQAEIHATLCNFHERIDMERRRSLKSKRSLWKIMSELQKQLTAESDRSTQNWGVIASDLIKFHERCLPKRTHADFEVDIAAVKHRKESVKNYYGGAEPDNKHGKESVPGAQQGCAATPLACSA